MEFAPAPFPADLEAGYRASGFHTDVVVPQLLQRNVFEFGRATAVIDDAQEVSWAELADAAARLAAVLAAHDIGPGAVVVWQLPNWWEALAVAHAIWMAGAISVPVVPIYREHELATIMRAVHPECVIGPPSFRVDTMAPLDAVQTALPSMPGPFFGRGNEIVSLLTFLRSKAPVVTVWGAPGVGKTRLVVEAVRQAVETEVPAWDAIVYAELAEARDAGDVVRTLATAARISLESTATPEITLASALGKLGRGLLVLDRAEHLAALVGTFVQTFRREAPRLQVIATSRRKACPPGAVAIELGPLPAGGSSTRLSPSAALLLERAGLASDHVDPQVADRAEAIAAALEGNPLAIELSATTAQVLGLDGLFARVTSPEGSLGDVHASMRSTLERSFELLSDAERSAFAQCAVCLLYTSDAADE